MIYLTRLMLQSRSKLVRSEIMKPHEMRTRLARVFGDEGGDIDESAFLYRVERSPRPHVLVQTKFEPGWPSLGNLSEFLAKPPEVKVIKPKFSKGDRFLFRLRANPTLRVAGKRHGLYEWEDQAKWLARKAEDNGFSIKKFTVRQEDCLELHGNRGRVTKFATVQYDGELDVINPLMFADAFENGVGSARAMGYGLLSLARCR